MTIRMEVDGRLIAVPEDRSVLQACLENDIYIPNLCYLEEMAEPPASCRLCFVEVEGMAAPVTSCTLKVEDGMRVRTDTAAVRRLQRTALQLLLSVHHLDCKNCPANKNCELQRMAVFLKSGLKLKQLEQHLKPVEIDTRHPCLDHYPNRCVLCGKCIHVCRTAHGYPLFDFAGRGFDTLVNYYTQPDENGATCNNCTACVDICPVGALIAKTA